MAASSSAMRILSRLTPILVLLSGGQLKGDTGAAGRIVLGIDAAPMGLDDGPAHRQPDPHMPVGVGMGAAHGQLPLKDPWQDGRWDAHPVVGHRDPHPIFCLPDGHGSSATDLPWAAALSNRFTNTCSMRVASMEPAGSPPACPRPPGSGCPAELEDGAGHHLFHHLRFLVQAHRVPVTLVTDRMSLGDPDQPARLRSISRSSSRRSSSGRVSSFAQHRADADDGGQGVRKSWDTERSRLARICSIRTSSRSCSCCLTRLVRVLISTDTMSMAAKVSG